MNWLEVINVRSAGKNSTLLEGFLTSIGKHGQIELLELKIYRHATIETDVSVHLHWSTERPEANGSGLGVRLARAFEEFGLVSHSVWIEGRP